MPSSTETFAQRLAAAIEASGLSMREVSVACGEAFTPRTLFRWTAGDAAPGVEAVPILCAALNVTADWLTGTATQH